MSENGCDQVEEYRGARDLDSLKQFVTMMKAKVALTVDIGDEQVPEYKTHEEHESPDEDGDDEEEDAEEPAEVCHFTCIHFHRFS